MDRGYYDAVSDTSTLFWGAVIFVAQVAACLLIVIGKAIGLRNRRRFDGSAVEVGHTKDGRFEPSPLPNVGRYIARDRRVFTDRPDPWAAQGDQGTPEGA